MVTARHRPSPLPANRDGERLPPPWGCSRCSDLGERRHIFLRPRVADPPVRTRRSGSSVHGSAWLDQQWSHELLLPRRRTRGTPGIRHRRVSRAPQNHPSRARGARRNGRGGWALHGHQRWSDLGARLGCVNVDRYCLRPWPARSTGQARSRTTARLHPHADRRRRHRGPRRYRHGLHPSPDRRSAPDRDRTHGACDLRSIAQNPLRTALLHIGSGELGRVGRVRRRSGRCRACSRSHRVRRSACSHRSGTDLRSLPGLPGAADRRDGETASRRRADRGSPPTTVCSRFGTHGRAISSSRCSASRTPAYPSTSVSSPRPIRRPSHSGSPSVTWSASRPES